MAVIRIDFRLGGNSDIHLGSGWSSQEPNHRWAVGSFSTLNVSGLDQSLDYRLSLEVEGYVPSENLPRRRFDVIIGERSIGSFQLGSKRETVICNIARDWIASDGSLIVRFEHPEPIRPCDFGGSDTRPLAVAFHAVTFRPQGLLGDVNNKGGNTDLKVAALTFVFNESVNLPIWTQYYGKNFGAKNLFIVDRESTDGSTKDLGEANCIVVPRDSFDDRKKANFLSSMQNALLNYYDVVLCTDCDEIVVPDLQQYKNLYSYIQDNDFDYVTSIGLNIRHIIHKEMPINLDIPILSQRRYATFYSATCKTLLSRVPIKWQPGLHCLNFRPKFDPALFMLHTKAMDYDIAAARYKINRETPWSDHSLKQGHGGHHRYEYERTVREMFLEPATDFDAGKFASFEFTEELQKFENEIKEKDGVYWIPMNIKKHVVLPEWMGLAF